MLKVKVISLPYIFQVLYVLCFTRPRYQVSVYRTIGPLVNLPVTFLYIFSDSSFLTSHYDYTPDNTPMQYTLILIAVKMVIFG